MIEPGQIVGNYRVTAKLGGGGMGAVYLAEHPVIGRRAALKVIHPQYARNAEVVTRFVKEATAINRVGHEHIVEVTDFGRTPAGDFYFIMEYLEGETLSEKIAREGPFAPARAATIAAQIADALSASHAHGVIHRDLKPENIFLVARGDDPTFVKVLDFGLAKLVDDEAPWAQRSTSATVMGTPYYMAPEQCEGRSELDARADIYSLGVVLFEMLTGRVPFDGETYSEVFAKQLTMSAPSARQLVPAVPEVFDGILRRALAKEPAERFSAMAPFREALRATLDDSALARGPRQRGSRAAALVVAAAVGAMGLVIGLSASALPPAVSFKMAWPPGVPPASPFAAGVAADDAATPDDAAVPADGGVAGDANGDGGADAGDASGAVDATDGPELGIPPPTPIVSPARRPHRARLAARAPVDEDDVLAPSFVK